MSGGIKTTKMMQWLDYRVRVTVSDNRVLVGTFKAFDKYMNLVLSDCEELCLGCCFKCGSRDVHFGPP